MDHSQTAQKMYLHWSAHCSLYSGKTRSYLIKKGLNFAECNPGHPNFADVIAPKFGFFSIPVLECLDGEIVQDTTAIIEHLEAAHPWPAMQPEDPVLRAVCGLIHNYGTEGLFKPAQHYRWNFRAENYKFIIDEFSRGLVGAENRGTAIGRARAEEYAQMKVAALPRIGVTPKTIPAIEASTQKLFKLLDGHFRLYPYILGGRPSVADCGLMTALHAHLGRDPYPLRLMKETAPALHRWTETMNRPGIGDPELWDIAPEYFDAQSLPETFLGFLELVCADFGPELTSTAAAYHRWLDADPARPVGSLVSIDCENKLRQNLGMIDHVQQETVISREAWPDILMMHQSMTEIVDAMSPQDFERFTRVLSGAGGAAIASLRLSTPLRRDGAAIVIG